MPSHRGSHDNNNSQSRLSYHRPSCLQDECEHGLVSPHASRPTSSSSTRPSHTHALTGDVPTYSGSTPQSDKGVRQNDSGHGGSFGGRHAGETSLGRGLLGDAFVDGVLGDGIPDGLKQDPDQDREAGRSWTGAAAGTSTTQWLAKQHGVKGRRTMYVSPDFIRHTQNKPHRRSSSVEPGDIY